MRRKITQSREGYQGYNKEKKKKTENKQDDWFNPNHTKDHTRWK